MAKTKNLFGFITLAFLSGLFLSVAGWAFFNLIVNISEGGLNLIGLANENLNLLIIFLIFIIIAAIIGGVSLVKAFKHSVN